MERKTKDGHPTKMMQIAPSLIRVCESYQRHVPSAEVDKLVKEWDVDLCEPIKVSFRDGVYWVFDGQHRTLAWIVIYGENKPINCVVYYGMTETEEEEAFVKQSGRVVPIRTFDKLRAEWNHNKPEVRDMVTAAEWAGVKFNFAKENKDGRVNVTYNAIWKLYNQVDRDTFIRILTVIEKGWRNIPDRKQSRMINAVGLLYKAYHSEINDEKFISKVLSKHTPSELADEARILTGPRHRAIARIMLKHYNYRRTNQLVDTL